MADNIALSSAHHRVLQNRTISESEPGAVLRDFASLLDFIRAREVIVSGKHQLLPMSLLAELNSRLSRTNQVSLKRPQQKSYSYIHGLYLLLRVSGLSLVENRGRKQFLLLDEDALQSWHGLNMTERYFTLLGAWLIRGRGEILGEDRYPFSELSRCRDFVQRIPKAGLRVAGDKQTESMIPFQPGLRNIALLDLFGLISVEHGESETGRAWSIARILRTSFGDALFRLLSDISSDEVRLWEPWGDRSDEAETLREFQSRLQPFFPEWRETLTLAETPARDGLHVFKVSLGRVWRRIAIPGEMTLEALSEAILDAFDFDNDHLHLFRYRNRFGIFEEVKHPYTEESPSTAEVKVGELPLRPSSMLEYLFDFGDNWLFEVWLEKLEPLNPKLRKPMMIEGRGQAPTQYPNLDNEEWDEE
ncbi:MAG TPA: plasmid pRiA4b ORF-3 family protein [Pyrinomonadaceae bacterium]|nr:plasmid pRiA4b ORF-3 family protein [Pyrinomonadaceae bacterium]